MIDPATSGDVMRICHVVFASHGPLFLTLFVGGLVGGVTHCAGMCGPFVLSQTAAILDDVPLRQISDLTRLRGGALVPYHAGRMTTYAVLGAVSATMAAPLRVWPWFGDFSAALLALAGLMFLFSAFPALRLLLPSLTLAMPNIFLARLRGLFAHPRGWNGYLLGLALGLLPCGLVYAALFSVAARGQPLTAFFGMTMFAAGTIPALLAVGVGGQLAFRKFNKALRYVFPVLMTMNSLTLFAMAGALLK